MSAHIPLADDSFEEEYNKIKEHFSLNLRTFNSQPSKITDIAVLIKGGVN